jgi:tetratricopeptide (TPR) repeat protein
MDDGGVPDGLLDGLADEIEAEPLDTGALPGIDDNNRDGGNDMDLSSATDLGEEESPFTDTAPSREDAGTAIPGGSGEAISGDGFDNPDDFSIPDIDEMASEEMSPEETLPDIIDDTLIPDDEMASLFSETSGPVEDGETPETLSAVESSDVPDLPPMELDAEPDVLEAEDSLSGLQDTDAGENLGDMDFSIPDFEETGDQDAPSGTEGTSPAPDLTEGLDLGGEGLDLGGEGLDLGGEGLDLGGEGPDLGGEGLDLGGEGLDLGGEGLDLGGEGLDLGGEGLDLGGEEGGVFEEPSPDSFDAFNLDTGELSPDFNIPDEATAAPAGKDFSDEEFSLAGIDDVFSGAPSGTAVPGMGTSPGSGTAGDTVEEIQLNEEEFDRLRETLESYPLNLRIACEELIAEQAVAPDLMSSLIKTLIRGAPAKETAALAGKILGRTIPIPKGFEKQTGEDLEAEQASFAYIFVHKFLPVLRLFFAIVLVAASLFYLIYRFIYTPLRANSIYAIGYERIGAGEYARANERFNEAFRIHRVKKWFYRYAEAFRDARQYIYAEEKYDELLQYYPRDKKGALDYASMETNYLRNYAKADRIIRRNILDYVVDDKEGLLALGDNNLLWGEVENARYEDARSAYARLLERYGWEDPIVERMLKYFIRTDNLGEVLPLQQYFMGSSKHKISPPTLAELGGYLLDKRLEEPQGVPDEHIGLIEGIRDILIKAVQADPSLPESHYHLARYYNHFGNTGEERQTLERAIRAFDAAPEESARRTGYRIDTQRRYAQVLIKAKEFFAAEEQLVKGIDIYEDAVTRRVLPRSPESGRLYADLGDLAYFTKAGDMEQALQSYLRAERNGWAPPEIQYRMGSAYYHQQQWAPALERFFTVSSEMPLNRRALHALGNTSYMRGNYFAAQGYYNRLLDILETERARFPMLMPNDRPEYLELAERMMVARNNLGVTLEALTERTGNGSYRSRALGLYTESARAWDTLTRDPETMLRAGVADLSSPGINLAYLNARNALYPEPGYEQQIYLQIDKDVLEPSAWEDLVPSDSRLSDELSFYR